MSNKSKVFFGLDIGTSKTCIVAVRKYGDEKLEIVGSGLALSLGLMKSIIVNPGEVTNSICMAAKELEVRSSIYGDWVFAGISGKHGKSLLLRGAIAIEGKQKASCRSCNHRRWEYARRGTGACRGNTRPAS